uniref:Putative transporter C3H1.06c n=1 Tax=Talaromyces marneffei PM1 TaxID=1077442 RepID=A0A093VNG3_TALMA
MTSTQSTQNGKQAVFRALFRKNSSPPSSEITNTDEPSPSSTTLETFKDQQSNILPHNKLMIVFPTIALAQMISYLDQTCVSTAVPAIGESLNMGPSISWIATSFLLASTSIQLVNGRLSDIVGRKPLLLICMGILAGANLCAGFAQNAAMLFAFRSIAGLGGGAITALVMIIASDITTLEQRGKYNGFIGAMVGLGNGIGPLIGGALTQHASWRWCFWFIVPVIVVVMVVIAIVIPPSTVRGNAWTKLRMLDWLGLVMNVGAVVLVLIPISQGGSTYPWDGTLVIAMLTISGLLIITFVLVEWKFAKLPMMPKEVRLFQSDKSANLVFLQGTLHGVVYWANLFYIPMYLQTVRGYSPILSGAIILPMVASHGVGSLVSGHIISKTGHYGPLRANDHLFELCLVGGCVVAVDLHEDKSCVGDLFDWVFAGDWIGGAFQPGLVALLAHSRKADRAVTNSLRNFLRILGGSVGLTISGTILNNTLKTQLRNTLPLDVINTITSSAYSLSSINLSPNQYEMVMDAYMAGMHTIFVMDEGVAEKDARAPVDTSSRADEGRGSEKKGVRDGGEGSMVNSPSVGRQERV